MLRENNRLISNAFRAADLVITAVSFYAAYLVRDSIEALPALRPFSEYAFLLLFILPLWAGFLWHYGAYTSIRTKRLAQILSPVLKGALAAVLVLMTLLFAFKLLFVSRALLVLFFVMNTVFLAVFKASALAFTHYIRKKGYNFRTILIVGTGKRAEEFARLFRVRSEWGIHVLGFMEIGRKDEARSPGITPRKIIGHVDNLQDVITSTQIDEVVFIVPRKLLDRIEEPVLACEQVGIKASIAADFYPHTIAKMEAGELEGWPLMVFNPIANHEKGLLLKRALDIAVSCAVLILVSPILSLAALGLKLSSPGPVFFRQVRCGMNGRRFNVLKFRTMVAGADERRESVQHLNEMSGPVFKAKNDPRVTPFGRFMRKYSIDELPQFINVLTGDMSIVGPRPPLPSEVEKYDLAQRRRLSVKPGITCLWQVNGRNRIGFADWVRLDLEYIDKWSFWLDVKIILKTVPAVLRGTGV